MAKKLKDRPAHEPGPPKRTSIGSSTRSRPKNKHKRRPSLGKDHKPYNRQGK
jgi:hypothetical protein